MSGIDELKRLADDLEVEADVASDRVEKAVDRATEHLYHLARGSAPRDTGELYNSIQRDQSGLSRRVWSDTRQGFFQEFGTAHQPPQPWLMVHSERARERLVEEIAKEAWDGT